MDQKCERQRRMTEGRGCGQGGEFSRNCISMQKVEEQKEIETN